MYFENIIKIRTEIIYKEKLKEMAFTNSTKKTRLLRQTRVQTSNRQGSHENEMVKYAQLSIDLDKLEKELEDYLAQSNYLIGLLDNYKHSEVLKLRYIDGYKWDGIADQMDYSIRQIHNFHRIALRKIESLEEFKKKRRANH